MGRIIWLIITVPCSMLFTGIGIYAFRRKKPMWFWSGTTVSEREIRDVPAYNRANGIMWISFSAFFWLSAVLGYFRMGLGGLCLAAGCLLGVPLLPAVYSKIYSRYKR